jgi:glutathione S-transferase
MSHNLTLVSHHLCPYVQRAAISLFEKQVPFERLSIDLSDKPDWFTALSPLGKVPLLMSRDHVIFESAVILEYLEETLPAPLHPANPERRAEHRSWIEFGSSILNDIGGFYSAADAQTFEAKRQLLRRKFNRLERAFTGPDWFDAAGFSLVDTVYGPIFRYFDTFERIADFGVLDDTDAVVDWRRRLAARASVAAAVEPDYPDRLMAFLVARRSYLSGLIAADVAM